MLIIINCNSLPSFKHSVCIVGKINTVDSLLVDTSVKWTPRVGPCVSLLPYLTFCKRDIT